MKPVAIKLRSSSQNKDEVRCFAPAKVNLILRVFDRQPDNYHAIASLLCPLDFGDELRLLRRPASQTTSLKVHYSPELAEHISHCSNIEPEQTALSVAAMESNANIAVRAIELLRHENPQIADVGVEVELQKCVPFGAGLGAGSSDAAAALVAMRALTGADISDQKLLAVALKCGADVPAILAGGLVAVSGRGEILESALVAADTPFGFAAKNFGLVIAKPPQGSNTVAAYKLLDRPLASTPPDHRRALIGEVWSKVRELGIRPADREVAKETQEMLTLFPQAGISEQPKVGLSLREITDNFVNDFGKIITGKSSLLTKLEEGLREVGVQRVLLAGSGSALVGFCPSYAAAEQAGEDLRRKFGPEVFLRTCRLMCVAE